MDDLIARLEAAEGPSPELDRDIYRALGCVLSDHGFWTKAINGDRVWHEDWQIDSGPFPWKPREITASIDAALTLVPERHGIEMAIGPSGHGDVTVFRKSESTDEQGRRVHTFDPVGRWNGVRDGVCTPTSPAICLCIAALRARSAAPGA